MRTLMMLSTHQTSRDGVSGIFNTGLPLSLPNTANQR